MPIKNLLFDLGKVLYEIDIDGMVNRFNALVPSGKNGLVFSMEGQPEMFDLLDKGQIEKEGFVKKLTETFQLQASQEDVMEAWYSILVGLIPGRVEALRQFALRYEVGILSNTNAFHHQQYQEEVAPLFDACQHIFLSYQLGLRKPDPAIYHRVLRDTGWRAEETLFVDDGIRNTQIARQLGFQTLHFKSEADFEGLTHQLL